MAQTSSFVNNGASQKGILKEIRIEQKISPLRDIEELEKLLKEGIYELEEIAGSYIDFDTDLKARGLLKDFVLFADHNAKSKFREEYYDEYLALQIRYNRDSNV